MSSVELELIESSVKKKNSTSLTGKIFLALTGGTAFGLCILCAPFVAPAFRRYCLPYVPATNTQIENVLKFLRPNNSKNVKLLDIGSGDGRIVIAAAKEGYSSDGVELNTWLVQYSRLSALKNGVFLKTKFFQKNLWKFNVSPYKYIVIFGVEQMMKDLEQKLLKESNNNTKIIACRFPLPNLVATKIAGGGVDTVWYYEIKKDTKDR